MDWDLINSIGAHDSTFHPKEHREKEVVITKNNKRKYFVERIRTDMSPLDPFPNKKYKNYSSYFKVW